MERTRKRAKLSPVQITAKTAAVLGSATAALYFAEGERGITKNASCTYLAPWTTDAAAWVIGAALLMRGLQTADPLVTFAGAAVATLHVAQFAAHKVITRPEFA